MHSMHSLHSLLPSISKRARRGLTSNFPHWHSAVLGGNAQPKSCTPSPKHCQFSDLPGNDENTVFVETLTDASKTSLRWEQEQLENTVVVSATGKGVRTIFHNGE